MPREMATHCGHMGLGGGRQAVQGDIGRDPREAEETETERINLTVDQGSSVLETTMVGSDSRTV